MQKFQILKYWNQTDALILVRDSTLPPTLIRPNAGKATVSVFDFDDTSVSDLKILHFSQAQKEWLEYVTMNRKNQVIPNDDYDIVIGPVANDRTMPVISLYFAEIYNIEETIKRLMPQKLCDQYTFRTEKAIKKLNFLEVK